MQTARRPPAAVQLRHHERRQVRAAWLPALNDWGPVVFVAAVSGTGVGLEQPWTGSDLELALAGLATALPLHRGGRPGARP